MGRGGAAEDLSIRRSTKNSRLPVVEAARLPTPAWRKEKEKQSEMERGSARVTDYIALQENGKNVVLMVRYLSFLIQKHDKEKTNGKKDRLGSSSASLTLVLSVVVAV